MPGSIFSPPPDYAEASSSSAAAPSPSYAMISFNHRDRIRLMQFPPDIAVGMRDVVRGAWPQGIKVERDYCGSPEFHLNGSPFGSMGEKEGVASRRLVRNVLAFLYDRSWLLVTALSHNQRIGSKDSLVFKLHGSQGYANGHGAGSSSAALAPPPPPPPAVDWLVVMLASSDKLRIICDGETYEGGGTGAESAESAGGWFGKGASESANAGGSQIGALVTSLKKDIERLDYLQGAEWSEASFDFKLKGRPWFAFGENTVKSRMLILRLVETLDRYGWKSYSTIRQRTSSDSNTRADTWYFVRSRDWVAGSPFNGELPSMLDM